MSTTKWATPEDPFQKLKETFLTKDDFYHPEHGIIARINRNKIEIEARMNRNFIWLVAIMVSMAALTVIIANL